MKYLIAGFGSIGRRHFRNLVNLGEEEIIFYRTRKGVLGDPALKNYPVETDLKRALDHQPDAVIVSNPTAFHLEVAQPAVEQGCHLLLEKPVSHNLHGVDHLLRTASATGSMVLVGYQFRFHPHLVQIKEWLEAGILGQVGFVRAQWGEYLPDWHPWEDYRTGYSARQDLGGGVILTLSHPIDYLLWLFGGISEVCAASGEARVLDIEVEELISAHMRFENGLLGSLHLNYLQRPPDHQLIILGSRGEIHWNYHTGVLTRYSFEEDREVVINLPEGFTRNELFLQEMSHFREVIRKKEPPICSLEDGLAVQRVCSALHHSLSEKTWIGPADLNGS